MIRWFTKLALLMAFPIAVLAQTATVTTSVRTPAGGVPANSQVCFSLQRFQPNIPKVNGVAVINQARSFCVSPDVNGDVSTALYRNDNITPSGTDWRVEYKQNGIVQSAAHYTIAAASVDLTTLAPNTT